MFYCLIWVKQLAVIEEPYSSKLVAYIHQNP
jgi:hypothetical protein